MSTNSEKRPLGIRVEYCEGIQGQRYEAVRNSSRIPTFSSREPTRSPQPGRTGRSIRKGARRLSGTTSIPTEMVPRKGPRPDVLLTIVQLPIAGSPWRLQRRGLDYGLPQISI